MSPTPPKKVVYQDVRNCQPSRGSSPCEVKVLKIMIADLWWFLLYECLAIMNYLSISIYTYIYNYIYAHTVGVWSRLHSHNDDSEWCKTEQYLCSILGILGSWPLPAMTSSLLAALKSQQGKGATVTVYPLIEAKWERLWMALIQTLDCIVPIGNPG